MWGFFVKTISFITTIDGGGYAFSCHVLSEIRDGSSDRESSVPERHNEIQNDSFTV